MKMHRSLGLAGRARGEGDQAGIVGGGDDVGEARRLVAHARLDAVRPAGVEIRDMASVGQAGNAAVSSSASLASQSACVIAALLTMSVSSFARSSGMVATAMPPAFITANQHAASIGLFGPRSSTRLPGTSSRSSTSTLRNAVGASEQLGVRPARAVGRNDRGARSPATVDGAVEQLGGAVDPVRIGELRQLENELGP